MLDARFYWNANETYPLTQGGSRELGGLFHFPLPIPKSSLMVQIGVGPLPLQLFY